MYALIAIPIPRHLQEQIEPLRAEPVFQKLLRPSRIELHITLKAPQQIADLNKDTWLNSARKACKGFSAIDLNITGLNFITTTVLALDVDPAALLPLHQSVTEHLEKYNDGAYTLHEGERFRPHITIGRAIRGPLNAAERAQILEKLTPLIKLQSHQARLVRLYGRDEGAYRPLLDIKLEN